MANTKIGEDAKRVLQDKKQILEKSKELYMKMPKKKKDIFEYNLDWSILFKHNTLERVVRPWLAKMVKKYLGQEEESMVSMVLKKLQQKVQPKILIQEIEKILDDDSEEFVQKLWQTLIFEDMKGREGLLK